MPGFIYRENRVPYYQRLFQEGQKQHVRQWLQTKRGRVMYKGYLVMLFGSFSASMYMMGRLALGHKTWFGEK